MTDDGTLTFSFLHDPQRGRGAMVYQMRAGEQQLGTELIKLLRDTRSPIMLWPLVEHHEPALGWYDGVSKVTLAVRTQVVTMRHYEAAPMMAVAPENVYFPTAQHFSFRQRLRFLFTGKLMT